MRALAERMMIRRPTAENASGGSMTREFSTTLTTNSGDGWCGLTIPNQSSRPQQSAVMPRARHAGPIAPGDASRPGRRLAPIVLLPGIPDVPVRLAIPRQHYQPSVYQALRPSLRVSWGFGRMVVFDDVHGGSFTR